MIAFSDVEVGTELPTGTFPVERADLVRYAGASGDFNPIHWSDQTATAVGLPGVIAHGMLTMAIAVRVITDWVGDPGALVSYGVRFTRPVPVEFDHATEIAVTGKVRSLNETDRTAEVDLSASVAGHTVLAKARVTVRLG